MRLSVVIPTRGGGRAVGSPAVQCVESLRGQLGPADEVIVSVDGPEADPWVDGLSSVRVVCGERGGPGLARNRALDIARGGIVLFLNDDVVAQPGLVEAHLAAHASGGPAMVLGAAPWGVAADDRVIDRLVRETSWIFFYDRMTDTDPGRDWGFRHAWTLNLSVPRACCVPFEPRLTHPMLDDLEWAWRVKLPVLYRTAAEVVHEHRYTARALLRREALLGHQAACLHGINPLCAREVFGQRFLTEDSRVRGALEAMPWVIDAVAEGYRDFERIAGMRADSFAGVSDLFDACRGWREAARLIGSVHAAEGRSADEAMRDAERCLAGDGVCVVVGDAA